MTIEELGEDEDETINAIETPIVPLKLNLMKKLKESIVLKGIKLEDTLHDSDKEEVTPT